MMERPKNRARSTCEFETIWKMSTIVPGIDWTLPSRLMIWWGLPARQPEFHTPNIEPDEFAEFTRDIHCKWFHTISGAMNCNCQALFRGGMYPQVHPELIHPLNLTDEEMLYFIKKKS